MTKKKDIKIDGQLFIGEDNLIKDSEDINVITEENLKEYADMLQFDTLAQECILEDLCKSYNINRDDMFILIHELKRRGNNIVTLNTSAKNNDDDLDSFLKKNNYLLCIKKHPSEELESRFQDRENIITIHENDLSDNMITINEILDASPIPL